MANFVNPIRKCEDCDRAFFSQVVARKHCGLCHKQSQRAVPALSGIATANPGQRRTVKCEHCGELAEVTTGSRQSFRFCSRKCAAVSRGNLRTAAARKAAWWNRADRLNEQSAAAVLRGFMRWVDRVRDLEARSNPITIQCCKCGCSLVTKAKTPGRPKSVCKNCQRESAMTGRWKRRSTERAARVSKASKRKIWDRDNWTCYMCGITCRPWSGRCEDDTATVDYLVPLSAGGAHSDENCKTACFKCNCKKSDFIEQGETADISG